MGQGLIRAVVVAVAGALLFAVAWALWPRPAAIAPRARQYLDASACLLAGADGVTPGTPGGRAWHAMESASLASHVMVSYLPATRPSAVPTLLSTLVERRCGVIVVTGGTRAQVAAAAAASPRHRFIFVVSTAAAGPSAVPPNTIVVPAGQAPARIDQEVSALAGTA